MSKNKRLSNPFYQGLQRNMVVAVLIVSLTPMILVSGFILNRFSVSYHEKVNAHLSELVRKHRRDIDRFLSEKLSNIRIVAGSWGYEDFGRKPFLFQELLEKIRQVNCTRNMNYDGR